VNTFPFAAVLALLAAIVPPPATAGFDDLGAMRHWSSTELAAAQGVLMTSRTHLFKIVRPDGSTAESHEGTSDIFYVVRGTGVIFAGGEIESPAALPGMPGELRGHSLRAAGSWEFRPGAVINIPPSTPYLIRGSDLVLVQLRINVGMHPWSAAATQQNTLAGTKEHPRPPMPVDQSQAGIHYWSPETLIHAHETMAKLAAAGNTVSDPRDLMAIPFTRTHAYNFMHRIMGADGTPPGVEYHPGTTDVYFVVAGTATLMTGGEIQNRRPVAGRQGEENGTRIRNGTGYHMAAGDVVNMPPLVPHQSLPDPGGYSYLLIKVNTGVYPWAQLEAQ
jgi:mannose-6-phosphate isomerase-like protein (cupin superfamily)